MLEFFYDLKKRGFFQGIRTTERQGPMLSGDKRKLRGNNLRKAGLVSCALAALLFSSPSWATNTTPTTGATTGNFNINSVIQNINNPSALAGSLVTGMSQGASVQSLLGGVSQGLTQNPAAAQQMPGLGNLGGILTALSGNSGANAQTGANLISQALQGKIPGTTATQMASIPGLGNNPLATAAVNELIKNLPPEVQNIVKGIMGQNQTAQQQQQQQQQDQNPNPLENRGGPPCCTKHGIEIPKHYNEVRSHTTFEFNQHRSWFLRDYWKENILPALMLMAEQLSVAGMQQVEAIGAILDAKQQLETQRTFQELTARAHKDYQPSEGMCTFGTGVRSLAASERKSNLAQVAFAQRMNQRQALSGRNITREGDDSDTRSRLEIFITTYCDKADNANGLAQLCNRGNSTPERRNIDVDYTRNIESRLTLDTDFQPEGVGTVTPDEQDVMALAANLFSQEIAPRIQPNLLGDGDKKVRLGAAERYMDLRAVFAKRSVAQNSFAAIASMRASGEPGSAPYMKALMKELGVEQQADIEKLIGKNPSYFAQMELLTKKIYQNPVFYTELYDKPANVERKAAAMQAIGLMQDRDLFNSLLRSEAVLSVLLETMLQKRAEAVASTFPPAKQAGGSQ
jgi:hypothetical protein